MRSVSFDVMLHLMTGIPQAGAHLRPIGSLSSCAAHCCGVDSAPAEQAAPSCCANCAGGQHHLSRPCGQGFQETAQLISVVQASMEGQLLGSCLQQRVQASTLLLLWGSGAMALLTAVATGGSCMRILLLLASPAIAQLAAVASRTAVLQACHCLSCSPVWRVWQHCALVEQKHSLQEGLDVQARGCVCAPAAEGNQVRQHWQCSLARAHQSLCSQRRLPAEAGAVEFCSSAFRLSPSS